jgi:SAM-dependent methyltransferase
VADYKGGPLESRWRSDIAGPGRREDVTSAGRNQRRPATEAPRPPAVPEPPTLGEAESLDARARFRNADRYRASREWQRYEGTSQRDLFRRIRERFLARHSSSPVHVIDVGSGPGRFTGRLGRAPGSRRVALDISREMLLELPRHWSPSPSGEPRPDRVLADASHPPFRRGIFGVVAALGNILGFAAERSDQVFDSLTDLLAPGGTILLEVGPGPGERSRYLHRLPGGAVMRLFRSPPGVVAARILREGFVEEAPRRKTPGDFHRIDPMELSRRLQRRGFRVDEVVAVAPALGSDDARAEAVSKDTKAWEHLLEVEETVGRTPARWAGAAAVLLAATGPGEPAEGTRPSIRQSEG